MLNFVPEDNRKMNNKNDNPNKLIIAKKLKWLIKSTWFMSIWSVILIFWQWLAYSDYRFCYKCLTTDSIIRKIAITIVNLSIHKNHPVGKVRF